MRKKVDYLKRRRIKTSYGCHQDANQSRAFARDNCHDTVQEFWAGMLLSETNTSQSSQLLCLRVAKHQRFKNLSNVTAF